MKSESVGDMMVELSTGGYHGMMMSRVEDEDMYDRAIVFKKAHPQTLITPATKTFPLLTPPDPDKTCTMFHPLPTISNHVSFNLFLYI